MEKEKASYCLFDLGKASSVDHASQPPAMFFTLVYPAAISFWQAMPDLAPERQPMTSLVSCRPRDPHSARAAHISSKTFRLALNVPKLWQFMRETRWMKENRTVYGASEVLLEQVQRGDLFHLKRVFPTSYASI